jgi:hypothetical protein
VRILQGAPGRKLALTGQYRATLAALAAGLNKSSNHRVPPLVGRIRYLRSSGAPPPRLGESGREQGTTFIDKQGTLRPSPLLAEIRSTTLVLARCLGGIQMNPGPAAKNPVKQRAGQKSWAARSGRETLKEA